MEYKLTIKTQYSKRDNLGVNRNYILFFLNGVLILKQKIPFDSDYEKGFDRRTSIYDIYILNNKLYQKRKKWLGCSNPANAEQNVREIYYPLSKKVMSQFNIPEDFKIEII